jgi:hypothetical protein
MCVTFTAVEMYLLYVPLCSGTSGIIFTFNLLRRSGLSDVQLTNVFMGALELHDFLSRLVVFVLSVIRIR